MNKLHSFLIALLAFVQVPTFAQTTYYYKLTKKVHNRTVSTDVSGGQFITFAGDVCFESNKSGTGVGHGTLVYNKSYSNNKVKVYTGKSYWGDKSTFRFSTDLTTLNVATRGGDVYVYKKTVAPRGVTTCSLIRRSSPGGGGGSGGGNIPVRPNFPSGSYATGGGNYGGGSYGGGASSGGSSQSRVQQRERKWRDCSLCRGKGTIVRDFQTPTYGLNDPKVYCAECGRSFYQSTGHNHVTCPTCHGNKGFWSE